jgi:transcriptional regulator with XRE-family HTH domain
MTLKETSDASGLTVAYLSDCERGRRLPSLPALLALSTTYRVLVAAMLLDVFPFGSSHRPRLAGREIPDGRRRPDTA